VADEKAITLQDLPSKLDDSYTRKLVYNQQHFRPLQSRSSDEQVWNQ